MSTGSPRNVAISAVIRKRVTMTPFTMPTARPTTTPATTAIQAGPPVDATVAGNPAIRVGTHLQIENAGTRFSNTYYVTSTLHRYDTADGYATELTAESAYLGN